MVRADIAGRDVVSSEFRGGLPRPEHQDPVAACDQLVHVRRRSGGGGGTFGDKREELALELCFRPDVHPLCGFTPCVGSSRRRVPSSILSHIPNRFFCRLPP